MFLQRQSGEITTWFAVFSRRVPNKLHNLLIPGRFKHVAAFGYSPEARTWVFIDPEFRGTSVFVVPEHDSELFISAFIKGGEVLRIDARKRLRGTNTRSISCCVSTLRDLIGLPGWGLFSALPDQLYRDCLRVGAKTVFSDPPLSVEQPSAPLHDPDHGIEPTRR